MASVRPGRGSRPSQYGVWRNARKLRVISSIVHGGRILTQSRTSVIKAVLKPFLVMISAAALLWCAAMAIHLAKAEVPTSIG